MERRAFLAGTGAVLLAAPLAAGAQPAGKVPRVGYLSVFSPSNPYPPSEAFWQGLHDLGWIEGQNIAIERRFAEGKAHRLSDLAVELVRLRVDLIFAETTPAARAVKQATTTIPIVFSPIADPIGSGLLGNLAPPGGNITGMSFMAPELGGKGLELLQPAVPGRVRVGVFSHPGDPSEATVKSVLEHTEAAARALGVQLLWLEAQGP